MPLSDRNVNRGADTKTRRYRVWNVDRNAAIANRVRLATTSAERRQGLLGVSKLDPGEGLWINPCEAVHTFGMKMPIDIVFLDREHRVRKIQREVGPNRIAFCVSAASVLELKAGTAAAIGAAVNNRLLFLDESQPNSSPNFPEVTSKG